MTDATRVPPVTGVCPVLATSFHENGEVDYAGFGSMVDHVLAVGARSVMFPGFASEYYKLSDAERTGLVTLMLERTSRVGGVVSVVSIPDHATHLAIRWATEAVELGASAINLLPPHQLAPGSASIREHIRLVAEAVAPTPVIVQYAPALTGTALDAATLALIARDVPNLVQVKVESTPPGALISALAAQDPALGTAVGYGGVQLIDALRRGTDAVQPGSSFVELYLRIWSAWQDGRRDEAIALHGRLLPYISYWMQSVELIIAAEKRISQARGLIESDHCRAPSHRLDDEETAMIARFLEEFEPELSMGHDV